MQNRIAIITLLDRREEWAQRFKKQSGIDVLEHQRSISKDLVNLANNKGYNILDFGEIFTLDDAISKFNEILDSKITSLVVHIPGWCEPNVSQTIGILCSKNDIPMLLWGSSALTGVLPTKGALQDADVNFISVLGLLDDVDVQNKILSFLNASDVYKSLQNKRLGVFGGLSMGIYNYFGNFALYKKFFGIDTVQFDEMQIVERKINEDITDEYLRFLEDNLKDIKFDNNIFTLEKLKQQIKVYLGVKEIIKENKINFVNIRCIPYFCDNIISPCLVPTHLNDPYDAEGKKEIIPCACEGDTDSSICMGILTGLSKMPCYVGDVMLYISAMNLFPCCACGGAPTFFSKRSHNLKENLKDISLVAQIQGKAGGGAIEYIAEKEEKITVCNLRKNGNTLEMLVSAGSIEPHDFLKNFLPRWPQVHVKLKSNIKDFLDNLSSQHVCISIGDIRKEIEIFSKLAKINYLEI